jgi:protease-4
VVGVAFLGVYAVSMLKPLSSSSAVPVFGNAIGLVEVTGAIEDSRETVRQIKNFSKKSNIKAILIRVDSPGGGVSASQEIYAAIKKAKERKKIVVSMGSMAASGGYYISAPATIIVANPGTVTGSIGVISYFPIVEGLLKKWGIKFEVVKSKEHKDIGSPFREMTESDRALLQSLTLDIYDQFVSAVSEERKIPKQKVLEFADGRLLSGRQAKELGLVDTLGTMEDAVRITADLAHIKGEPKIVKEEPRVPFFRQLIGGAVNSLLTPKFEYR